jgi:hypothetical protein
MQRLMITLGCAFLAVLGSVAAAQAQTVQQTVQQIGPLNQAPVPDRCVYVDASDPTELAAATALANWLSKATGRNVTVTDVPVDATAAGFYVGLGTPNGGASAYSIEVKDGKRVMIDAADGAALRMAVYDFLENDLGYRFWAYDEMLLPGSQAKALKDGKREVKAGFKQLHLWNREADNMAGDFRYATRSMFGVKFTGTHTLYALAGEYAQTHPDVYPMDRGGDRRPNNLHLCYSAKGLPEALADSLGSMVERRRGNVKDWVYFVGPGNVQGTEGGLCECNACQAVYLEEVWTDADGRKYPGHSATLIRMMNQVAGILEKRYPGIQVGVLAQMTQDAPPKVTKPAANLAVQVRRLNTDAVHAVDGSLRNQAFLRKIQRWNELAPGRTYVWEAGANFDNLIVPFPNLLALGKTLGVYHEMGIAGVMVEGSHGSPGSDAVVMKNWVISRKLWDPKADTAGLIKAFCDEYYGAASPKVQEYLTALEATVNEPKAMPISELEDPMRSYLTRENMAKLDGILSTAAAGGSADAKAYGVRLAQLRAGLQAARFWLAGPLEEKDDRLVRTDFDFDISGQVAEAVKNLRGGSARESGTAESYYQTLIKQSGGPAVTLEGDTVRAVVAPSQGGVWKVYYAELPIMQSLVVEPWGVGAFSGAAKEGNSTTFSGPVGVTSQVSEASWIATTRAEFKENSLGVVTQLKQTGEENKPKVLTRTEYLAAAGDRVLVEVFDGGQYVPVMFKAGDSKVSMGKFEGVRVRYQKATRTISDKYTGAGKGLTGELSHDKTTGTVTVVVKLPEMVTQAGKEVRAVERELVFGTMQR